MRPFKMFFGLSIAFMLFFFLAKIAIVAFLAAGIMSIIYAVYRRLRDFVTYDSYGEPYLKTRRFDPAWMTHMPKGAEPLFYSDYASRQGNAQHEYRTIKIS